MDGGPDAVTDYTLTLSHVWCPGCGGICVAVIDRLRGRDLSGVYEGIDLMCGTCRLVVTTVYRRADGLVPAPRPGVRGGGGG
jgi:hypothetical protein